MVKLLGKPRVPLVSFAVVLSLVLSIVVFYVVVEESTRAGIQGYRTEERGSVYVPVLNRTYDRAVHRGSLEFGAECYALLGGYDKLGFYASVEIANASYKWGILVEVEDLITGEVLNYTEVYHVARPPTPEFYAPRSSLYRVKYVFFVNFTRFYGDFVGYHVVHGLSGEQYRRLDFYSNAPVVLAVLAAVAVVLVLVGSRLSFMEKIAYTGFTGLVRYELRSVWLISLVPVNAVLYAFLVTRFNTAVSGITTILNPVEVLKTIDYMLFYMVVTAIVTVVLFAYKWENKHERSMDLITRTRLTRYFAKLTAVLTTTLDPVALTSLLLYITLQPELVFKRPDIFLSVYTSHLLYFLLITLFVYSVSSAISTLLPYTSASLFATVTLVVLLYIQSPLSALLGEYGYDLASIVRFLYPFSSCQSIRYPSPIPHPPTQTHILAGFPYIPHITARLILVPTLFLLPLSILLYSMRENP